MHSVNGKNHLACLLKIVYVPCHLQIIESYIPHIGQTDLCAHSQHGTCTWLDLTRSPAGSEQTGQAISAHAVYQVTRAHDVGISGEFSP